MKKLSLTCAAMLLFILTARADMSDIKKAMAERLPAINKLKSSQAAGENNLGYLDARKELDKDDLELLNAENADRKKTYEYLAAKTGTTAEVVGTRRAAQIAERSQAGVWLQKPDGTWYVKQEK